MTIHYIKASLLVMVMLFCACTNSKKQIQSTTDVQYTDTLQLDYATGFAVYYTANYKHVIVYNPWEEGEIFAQYYLVSNPETPTPADGTRLCIPLQKIAFSSSTHVEPLRLLGQLPHVGGVCTPHLIYNAEITQRYSQGDIIDLGDAMSIAVEKALRLAPEAIFMSGYNNSDAYTRHLIKAHINVIYNNEWMERSLLARAEWIKFMAVFFDQEAQATQLFADIAVRYDTLCAQAASMSTKPTVMTGGNFRGTWYVPAGDNYMARLLYDAGASYKYASDPRSGSIPLTVEQVVYEFANAEIWIGSSANTLHELQAMDEKHTYFRAFQNGCVYNFNLRTTPQGANDFWEMGATHPDIILADVMKILYPASMQDHDFVFVQHLQ